MRCPGAVVELRPGGPVQHPRGERNIQCRTQRRERALRVRQNVGAVDHQRRAAKRLRHLIEQLRLLDKADIGQRGVFALPGIACHHAGGVADQKHILAARHERPVKVGDHVQGHVLLVKQALTLRNRANTGRCHPCRIRLVRGDDLGSHRMGDAGFAQVGGIEGLVPDCAIPARRKAVQHRRGQVARAGPHRNPLGVRPGHAATSALYRLRRRSVTGPI